MPAKRQPRVGRVADKKKDHKDPTQRVNLQLGVDAYKRLGVHCTMEGTNPGETVTWLINECLNAWKMPAKNTPAAAAEKEPTNPVGSKDRLDAAEDVNAMPSKRPDPARRCRT